MFHSQQALLEAWVQGMEFGVLITVTLFFFFQVKHLVVDFFIQNRFPYMWKNKGSFFHPGGWLHALSHAVVTFGILWLFAPASGLIHNYFPWTLIALIICLTELLAHFLTDLLKVRIAAWYQWGPTTSPKYWDLLGVDQFLHQVFYLFIVLSWL